MDPHSESHPVVVVVLPNKAVKLMTSVPGKSLHRSQLRTRDAIDADAKRMSTSIRQLRTLLHLIVDHHEETMRRRWTKYNKQKRLKILLAAWPDMATHHRPDWDNWRRFHAAAEKSGTYKYLPGHRTHTLWPHINQEDMVKPSNFLLLLNARARHPPSTFAAGDFANARFGPLMLGIEPVSCEAPLIMRLTTAKRDHEELPAGEGLLVLEIQERLLYFLVKCSLAILRDVPYQSFFRQDMYPIRPEPRLKTEAESNGFASLVATTTEMPYRVPSGLDCARMERILGARVDAAKDHIRALREDPEYFVGYLNEARAHRAELRNDTEGNPHPVLLERNGDVFRSRLILDVFRPAYANLEVFSELHRQAKALGTAYAAVTLDPHHTLPEPFFTQLLLFRLSIRTTMQLGLVEIYENLCFSPNLSGVYTRKPPRETNDYGFEEHIRMRTNTSNLTSVQKQVISLLADISGAAGWSLATIDHLGIVWCLDELGRLIQTEPDAAKMISNLIAEAISDLAIYGHCLNQLDSFHPWAAGYRAAVGDSERSLIASKFVTDTELVDPTVMKRSSAVTEEYGAWADTILPASLRLHVGAFVEIGGLVDASGGRFRYPTSVKQTKEAVDARRTAEANLDALWRGIDQIFDATTKSHEYACVRKLLAEDRALRRTPEWPVTAADDVEMLLKPMSTLYFGSPKAEGSVEAVPAPKAKTKTKGIAREESLPTAPLQDEAPQEEKLEQIGVDARSRKVFQTLFFNPGVTPSLGEISWHDFVHAMTSTGLFAAEKLYGSAWQFERLDREGNARIQFHEPHPKSKVPFTVARRMGRRLTRAFGWTGATFVLKKQQTSV
ncbi:hypothetical protein OQA88_8680 [Cercophora sp. LCS_1]